MIASFLEMPVGTFNSLITGLNSRGLVSLEDGRRKSSSLTPAPDQVPTPEATGAVEVFPSIQSQDSQIEIVFGPEQIICLSTSHPNQMKCALLTLLNNQWLTCQQVAEILDFSEDHTRKLAQKLKQQDFEELLDQRRGQQQNYRVSPEIQSELIQQVVLNLVMDQPTSSNRLSQDLEERCQLKLASRTVTEHLSRLGLQQLKKTLPEVLGRLKKKSTDC